MSQREIGEILNITKGYLPRWYKKWGIQSEKILGIYHKNYKNGRSLSSGYCLISILNQSKTSIRHVYEYVLIAEKALGKSLVVGQEVHHVDNNKINNKNNNLVICENQKYHGLLHVRTKALKKSGNANNMKCEYCKKWDDLKNLFQRNKKRNGYAHKQCATNYAKERWIKIKNKNN